MKTFFSVWRNHWLRTQHSIHAFTNSRGFRTIFKITFHLKHLQIAISAKSLFHNYCFFNTSMLSNNGTLNTFSLWKLHFTIVTWWLLSTWHHHPHHNSLQEWKYFYKNAQECEMILESPAKKCKVLNYEYEMKLKSRLSCTRQQKKTEFVRRGQTRFKLSKERVEAGCLWLGVKQVTIRMYMRSLWLCVATQFTQGQSKSGDSWFD